MSKVKTYGSVKAVLTRASRSRLREALVLGYKGLLY